MKSAAVFLLRVVLLTIAFVVTFVVAGSLTGTTQSAPSAADDNEFDFVATHMVTHQIPDWQNALHQMLRVLKPNGYLIYKDFAFPKWVASLGKKIPKSLGYLTREDLNRFAQENHLAVVHLARSFNKYEAVWQKPA